MISEISTFMKKKQIERLGLSAFLRSSYFYLRVHFISQKITQRNTHLYLRHTYPNRFDAVPAAHNVLEIQFQINQDEEIFL